MSQVCELTGRRPAYGNKVSHSNIKTRTRWMPNLRKKKYNIAELGQIISILLSTRAIRTIDKLGGITPAIMKARNEDLSDRLLAVKNKIFKARVKSTATPSKEAKATHKPEAKASAPKAKAPKAAKPKAAKAKK